MRTWAWTSTSYQWQRNVSLNATTISYSTYKNRLPSCFKDTEYLHIEALHLMRFLLAALFFQIIFPDVDSVDNMNSRLSFSESIIQKAMYYPVPHYSMLYDSFFKNRTVEIDMIIPWNHYFGGFLWNILELLRISGKRLINNNNPYLKKVCKRISRRSL